MERRQLAPGYSISRIIKGGWQLAGGHGAIDRDDAVADMRAYLAAGVTAFDCADIYTGVEEMIGAFRREVLRRHGAATLAALKIHTKFVPDLVALPCVNRAHVRRIVDRSLSRLGLERLDLVQFHWWDYAVPRYVETAFWLAELQREGKIHLIGGTNFDAARTAELIAAGIDVRTMQVQYSVLDTRPEDGIATLCGTHGVQLLCYGTVAGGFLAERWLGASDPGIALENRSLVKYKLVIDDAGGWGWFQQVLRTLAQIARRHDADIASIASRFVLEQPHVAACIIGVRNRAHLAMHLRASAIALTAEDHAAIRAVMAQGRRLAGDIYALERDREGRHGRIMKYDLAG